MSSSERLAAAIRDVPDFPKPGIIFKDITPLLQDGKLLTQVVRAMRGMLRGQKIDAIVCVEARGFIFGAALAYSLGCGLVMVRKKGKLPFRTKSVTYALEYGTDTLEIHADALRPGMRVVIVDDVLATGGTVAAVSRLVRGMKASVVKMLFLIELGFLNGRKKLKGHSVEALLRY